MNDLEWLSEELNDLIDSPGHNVLVFGSTAMWLHGLREDVGDVDLFVTRHAWACLAVKGADRWKVKFPQTGDPPLLEWRGGVRVVHAFENWTRRDWWINVQAAWDKRGIVRDWPCVPLEMVRDWKVAAHKANPGSAVHEKHLADVAVIEAHLEEQAALKAMQAAAEPVPAEPTAVDEAGERWGV